jgi:hypothetical protein
MVVSTGMEVRLLSTPLSVHTGTPTVLEELVVELLGSIEEALHWPFQGEVEVLGMRSMLKLDTDHQE